MRIVLTLLVALWLFPSSALAEEVHACVRNRRIIIVDDSATQVPADSTPLSWSTEPPLVVFDNNGVEVGTFVDSGNDPQVVGDFFVRVFLRELPGIITFRTFSGELNDPDIQIWFAQAGCQGQAYIGRHPLHGSGAGQADIFGVGSAFLPGCFSTPGCPLGEARLFQVTRQPIAEVEVKSELRVGGTCDEQVAFLSLIPLAELPLDALGLTLPLPAPLYVAPRGTPAP